MSSQAGWYPDPGGVPNLYRYWDGRVWSAATSTNPQQPPPTPGLGQSPQPAAQNTQPAGQNTQPSGQSGYSYGQGSYNYGYGQTQPGAYANYQTAQKKKSPAGWWIAAAALVVVIVVVGVFAIRAVTRSGGLLGGDPGQPSQDVCPRSTAAPSPTRPDPNDGRVHGGPISYPRLGDPWSKPYSYETRVPFGVDVMKQDALDQANYQKDHSWVASVLVAELMAGDGFFTPEQGAKIVVRCVLGSFYDNNPVESNVKVDKATKIDGHDAWLIESQLSFDIPGLKAKGELLIVAVVSAGASAGLYYASIPDTKPELVQPARKALAELKVDG